ncbi:hypothetical protein [Salinisphaera shabanensis]
MQRRRVQQDSDSWGERLAGAAASLFFEESLHHLSRFAFES